MKAFLGMGLLGSNFVKAMLQKGDTVRVWNRTAAKAKVLEQFGEKPSTIVIQRCKVQMLYMLRLKMMQQWMRCWLLPVKDFSLELSF